MGVEKLRLRGDYDKFFALVKLYGFLHQRTLPVIEGANGHKAILVLPQHAFEALKIAEKPYVTMTTELEARTRKLVEKLEEMKIAEKGETISIDDRAKIAVELGLSEKTVRRYLKEWVTAGYMVAKQTKGRGNPLIFELIYDLDTIKEKTCVSLDITKIAEDKRLKFETEADSFLDSFRTKISYGRDWTEQKVREHIQSFNAHPWETFVQNKTNEELGLEPRNEVMSSANSPMSKVKGADLITKLVLLKEPYQDTCALCERNRIIYHQIENVNGEWGHICQDCGGSLQKKLQGDVSDD